MILGIVGSEQAKFTPETEERAREVIRRYLASGRYDGVTSGGCHLGGVDIFAREEANALGLDFTEFLPVEHSWDRGYKPRNMKIARLADEVICITVRELPPTYTGMRFKLCYHCKTDTHVKSGGCWTVKYAQSIGKKGEVIVV